MKFIVTSTRGPEGRPSMPDRKDVELGTLEDLMLLVEKSGYSVIIRNRSQWCNNDGPPVLEIYNGYRE